MIKHVAKMNLRVAANALDLEMASPRAIELFKEAKGFYDGGEYTEAMHSTLLSLEASVGSQDRASVTAAHDLVKLTDHPGCFEVRQRYSL